MYDSFIFIRDKNGEWQDQDLKTYGYISKRTTTKTISRKDKIVIFVYQQKILSDTGINDLAYTTYDNWEKRLTKDFDDELIFPINFSKIIRSFKQVRNIFIDLGFSEENIFEETNNENRIYTELGLVQG